MKKYCEHCPVCQLNRTDRQKALALPETDSTNTPWQLKGFKSYDALMTTTNKASKRTLLIPGHNTYKAAEWATILTSALWNRIWKALGTRLMMTLAYHPQADDQSDRKTQTVEIAIQYHSFT